MQIFFDYQAFLFIALDSNINPMKEVLLCPLL